MAEEVDDGPPSWLLLGEPDVLPEMSEAPEVPAWLLEAPAVPTEPPAWLDWEDCGGGSDAAAPAAIESRIVDTERVERLAADGLRLNLGCGHLALADYVNVDMRELPGVDVVAAIDDLPFDDGSVREIHSAHVLEHFAEEELHRRLLPYWLSQLEPGGEFRGIVPVGLSVTYTSPFFASARSLKPCNVGRSSTAQCFTRVRVPM